MSSVNRISTEVLKRQGTQKLTKVTLNGTIDYYINDNGGNISLEGSNISLHSSGLEPSFISINDFFAAKDFFMKNGKSESSAITMSKIVNDMALAMNVSVMSFLYSNKTNGILLNLEDYGLMNVYRPVNNRVSALELNNNDKCLRKRNIVP